MEIKLFSQKSPWRRYAVNLGLVILFVISAIYSGIYINNENTIEESLKSRARALYNSIILTRKWNANHGGVFVEKKAGMQSNPYLINPDRITVDGMVLTKKNPALMTREISEIAWREGAFHFHITSLKPLNPDNEPDAFERAALESFARGEKEAFSREKTKDATYYRYMAPLATEEPCLSCHAVQGYELGDVRGGISVRFNIDPVEKAIAVNRLLIVALFTFTIIIFLGIVYQMTRSLQIKLSEAEQKIRDMAMTDELTGLRNRRFLLNRISEEIDRSHRYKRPLSCILFDVDYFKRINDRYGHKAGDEVLKAISEVARKQCRISDLVGRYGGEEFLVILPETDFDDALAFAERLRKSVADLRVDCGEVITTTASFGVAGYHPAGDLPCPSCDDFIKRADLAMYEAKNQGRNRVQATS